MIAAAGVEKWYGVDFDKAESKSENDREFNASLAELYRKEIVDWKEDKAYIVDAYKHMFRTIRDAKKCIVIKYEVNSARGCYFSHGYVVTVERRGPVSDEIEIYIQSVSDWLDDLSASEMIPETAGIPDGDEVITMEGSLLVEFELRQISDGKLLNSMRIFEQGLYCTIELADDKSSNEKRYISTDTVSEELKSWIGGTA